MPDFAAIKARLSAVQQDHVLRFYDELDSDEQRNLLAQIEALDLRALPVLIERYVRHKPHAHVPDDLEPAPCYPLDHVARPGSAHHRAWDRERYKAIGEQLIRAGKVAAFTVAGGQGTRLGFDGPKGVFIGGAASDKPLFACLADWILAARERWGAAIPWYIMTSPLNHAATVGFFEAHNYLGLHKHDVMFFQQGVMPTFDMASGRILLAAKGEIATNPDGHGGSLRALATSGALSDMRTRGVEHISYTQIDNPLVRVIDPVFLGLHAAAPDSSAQMSSKMVAKAHAGEKVGVFCSGEGKTQVIEYSDLPERLAGDVHADGSLRFNAGSIAVHVIAREFVERLTGSSPSGGASGGASGGGAALALPYHRAEKKVPHIDPATGARVDPTAVNAVKLETFVFDAIPLAESSIVLETDRVEEFAPIKNADGADSLATCRQIQTERAARWLERAGVRVPRTADGKPDCTLEISPRTAMWAEDLKSAKNLPKVIQPGDRLAI